MITITESEVNTDGKVGAYIAQLHIPGRTERAWRHDAHARTVTLWYFLRDISEPADASCLNYRVLSNRRNISGQFGRASFDLKRRRMTLLHHAPTFTFPGTARRSGKRMRCGQVNWCRNGLHHNNMAGDRSNINLGSVADYESRIQDICKRILCVF